MKHRIHYTVISLRVASAIYLLIALLFGIFVGTIGVEEGFPESIEMGLVVLMAGICLGVVVVSEVVIWGLRRRMFWAWVVGLCLSGIYTASIFLPIGAFGLWGLLDGGSQREFRVGGVRGSCDEPTLG